MAGTDIDGIRSTEDIAFGIAEQLTAQMLQSALDIVESVIPGDTRRLDPALIAGLVTAMATNFSALTVSRK